MTEAPQQTPPGEAPPEPRPDPRVERPSGWNTDNLTDYRRLRRSRHDRKVAGVAGGLGRHLDVDPTLLRVLFVVLVPFGGAGLLLYAALWLFVPEEDSGSSVVRTADSTRNVLLLGVAVLAGSLVLGNAWDGGGFPWPLGILVLAVLAVLLLRDRGSAGRPPARVSPETQGATAYQAGSTVAAAPTRTGPLLFGPTLAALALVLGALGLYDALGGSVLDVAYPLLALTVIGAALVFGAFLGRAGGLIALGLLVVLALAVTSIGRPSYAGERDLVLRPTSAAELQDSYEVPAGRIELDLTGVTDLEALDGRTLDLAANAGAIIVTIPPELGLTYDAEVEFGGAVDTFGTVRDGWGTRVEGGIDGDSARMFLDASLRFGQIEVRQR